MASKTFKYKKLGTNARGDVIRPIVPVEVHKKKETIVSEVLLDSGADFSVFSAEVGEALGIEVRTGEEGEIVGVGGKKTKGYIHKIGITIDSICTYNTWAFFSEGLNGMHHGILGQKGFFEQFKVTFDYKKRHIVVRTK